MTVTIEEFKLLLRNSLRGFARVRMPSGMIFHDVSIHNSNGAWWASPASKPQINREGTCLRGKDDKVLYVPIVSFATRELRERFSGAIIEAIRRSHPEIFESAAAEAEHVA
jgi:hypothetical protein